MIVIDKKPIPIYEVECRECHSKIQYQKSEVEYCALTCPVCGMSIHAIPLNPVCYLKEFLNGDAYCMQDHMEPLPDEVGF